MNRTSQRAASQEFATTGITIDSARSHEKKNLHVLHVDDDQCFLEVSKQILSLENCFDVDTAESVDKALEKMDKQAYDVVVSDYEMPRKNGLDFLKELSDQKREIPFILFTGKGREEVIVKALNSGADRYINKNGSTESVYCELADAIIKTAESKKAKRLLIESELKYRTVVEELLQGVMIVFVHPLKIVFANKAITEILGYSAEEMLSMPPEEIAELIFNEDRAVCFERLQKRFRDEIAKKSVAFRAVRKDGFVVLVEASSNPIKYNGQLAMLCVFSDINERERTNRALKASDELFRELANSLPEMVFEADLNGKITYVNQVAFETTGYTQEDIEKGIFTQFFYNIGESERARNDFMKAIATSSTAIDEYVLRKKDGSRVYSIIKATPIKLAGKTVGLRGIVTDITEQKKTTETLIFQSQLLEAAGQALIAVDKNRIIRYWNRGAENLYGWAAEEVLGKSDEVLTRGVVKEQINVISNRLIPGENRSAEIQIEDRYGNMVPVIVTVSPVSDKAGELIGSISAYTDITDQKSTELELQGYVEEYAAAAEKIKQLNEKLRVIASLTRHDVRNKLAVLNNYMYLLKKKIVDNATAIRYLTAMEEASKQLLAILEFERVYEQIGSEELVYVNVEKFFAEASALVSDFKGINLECRCGGLAVLADSLLRQLLYNLMDNTLKYGEKTTLIRLSCKKDGSSMLLIYEDDGVGMTDEVRSHLFEKGFGKGTGFGLYMIKRIIEAYGWTIEENGKFGIGARFTIKIPENKFRLKENI
jgi:PAS domain S-box-containing protein